MARLGIMGGTFDPVHVGHLAAAEYARACLDLDEVVFVPAGRPWLKDGEAVSPAEDRLAMVEAAVGSNPRFSVSRIDLERPGPTYTVDTLADLARARGADAALYLLLGIDALTELHRWREPSRVLTMATVVGIGRPSSGGPDLSNLEAVAPGASRLVLLTAGPGIDVSGSDIRRRVAAGHSIRHLVPEAVGEYIRAHGLYSPVEVAREG